MARGGSSTVAADQASNRLLTQRFRAKYAAAACRDCREPHGPAAASIEGALWVAAAVLLTAALAPLAVREVRTMPGG
jgi:hypothetical protein